MRIERIDERNVHIHMNLAQVYEAEFAPLTHNLPDQDGRFYQHTARADGERFGYLLYDGDLPGGFGVFRYAGTILRVEELFICPHLRRQRAATGFLRLVADSHPGVWDIRQLEVAHQARAFWRRWAKQVDPDYTEDVLVDEKWGNVTRQMVQTGRSEPEIKTGQAV